MKNVVKWLSALLFTFFLIFTATQQASAHALSSSFTSITISDSSADVQFTIDGLSIIEYLNNDLDNNQELDQKEIDQSSKEIKKWFLNNIQFGANGKSVDGEFQGMKVMHRNNQAMVEIDYHISGIEIGQTLAMKDNLYMNDNNTNYVDFLTVTQGSQLSQNLLRGSNREWETILAESQQEQQQDQQTQQASASPAPKKVEQPAAVSNISSSIWDFLTLGMHHILTGYDHLLFLFALLIRKQPFKRYVYIVTAFTIAHSITLTLGVLGIVDVPSKFVESVIALSICYVALENIFRKEISHRWVLTFIFGLIHGLGFASTLAETPIPKSQLAISLVSFNFGIEIIQILLVLILVPILAYLQKIANYKKMTAVLSALIVCMGAFWVFERLFLS